MYIQSMSLLEIWAQASASDWRFCNFLNWTELKQVTICQPRQHNIGVGPIKSQRIMGVGPGSLQFQVFF
jgi:hypothetical protein